jgi:hypothetical protein
VLPVGPALLSRVLRRVQGPVRGQRVRRPAVLPTCTGNNPPRLCAISQQRISAGQSGFWDTETAVSAVPPTIRPPGSERPVPPSRADSPCRSGRAVRTAPTDEVQLACVYSVPRGADGGCQSRLCGPWRGRRCEQLRHAISVSRQVTRRGQRNSSVKRRPAFEQRIDRSRQICANDRGLVSPSSD